MPTLECPYKQSKICISSKFLSRNRCFISLHRTGSLCPQRKKEKNNNKFQINKYSIQSSPIQSRWSQQLWGCQQTQYTHLITSRYISQAVLWLWSIIFIFDQLSILNLTDLYCLPEGLIDLGESETNPKTPSQSPISNRFPYFLRPSVITRQLRYLSVSVTDYTLLCTNHEQSRYSHS